MIMPVRGCLRSITRLCSEAVDSPFSYSKCYFSTSRINHKNNDDVKNGITVTRDGSTIVCWHPEEPFPYEFSKPLPEEKLAEVNSVLKVQSKVEIMQVFKEKHKDFVIQELCQITYTSKHRWAPRKSDYLKQKVKPVKPPREWL